jgi:opacity protein-like surface antigen
MQIGFWKRNVRLSGAALCAVSVALIGAATTARAGLFNVPDEPADWNGIYMGFNAGVTFDHYNVSDHWDRLILGQQLNDLVVAKGLDADEMTSDSFPVYAWYDGRDATDVAPIGGIHFGYRKQVGHFVGGLEFGFEGTQTAKGAGGTVFGDNFLSDFDESEVEAFTRGDSSRYGERNWDGWVGGQIGFAWRRFLFYGTGGYTFTDVGVHAYDRARTFFVDDSEEYATGFATTDATVTSDIMAGWYAGGGAQFALNDKVTFGLEYRHSDFGDQVFRFHPAHPLFPGATRVDLSSDQIQFVVNVMLGHLGATAPH